MALFIARRATREWAEIRSAKATALSTTSSTGYTQLTNPKAAASFAEIALPTSKW